MNKINMEKIIKNLKNTWNKVYILEDNPNEIYEKPQSSKS